MEESTYIYTRYPYFWVVHRVFFIFLNIFALGGLVTDCVTPNGEHAYCRGIRQCEVLFKQWNNATTKKFLSESRCGPRNEDIRNPKVCCGKFDKFTNITFGIKLFIELDVNIIEGVQDIVGNLFNWCCYFHEIYPNPRNCPPYREHPVYAKECNYCNNNVLNINFQFGRKIFSPNCAVNKMLPTKG